jgi:hypothetical protein
MPAGLKTLSCKNSLKMNCSVSCASFSVLACLSIMKATQTYVHSALCFALNELKFIFRYRHSPLDYQEAHLAVAKHKYPTIALSFWKF